MYAALFAMLHDTVCHYHMIQYVAFVVVYGISCFGMSYLVTLIPDFIPTFLYQIMLYDCLLSFTFFSVLFYAALFVLFVFITFYYVLFYPIPLCTYILY